MMMPAWQLDLLNITAPEEGGEVTITGQAFVVKDGILRSKSLVSDAQKQTEETFGFKWKKRDTFESDVMRGVMREWLTARYGDMREADWLICNDDIPVVLDAGCGAALSGVELFGPVMDKIHYLGVDVSEAVDVAKSRFEEKGLPGGFMQADIANLPIADGSLDVIFSEGVLHHTDSTEGALKSLAKKLKPGGCFMFYVYNKKGPVREFTDDFVRAKLQDMDPNDAWEAMMPLTKLGQVLGELNIEIEVPEAIDLLEIPAGRINLQRLFYWHVFKAFYRPGMSLDEMNHINYDWYAPANAFRQTPEQVRTWCTEVGLVVEREEIEEAGITMIARKQA